MDPSTLSALPLHPNLSHDVDPSTIARHLSTNDAPSPLESTQLRVQLNAALVNSALHSRLDEAEELIKVWRTILSAIRLFPLEILGEIFVYVLEAPRVLDKEGRAEVIGLGLVCKTWRRATLATPQLWAGVSVDGDEYNFPKLALWFERGGNAPKSLTLRSPEWCYRSLGRQRAFMRKLEKEIQVDHFRLEGNPSCLNEGVIAAWSKCKKHVGGLWKNLRSFDLVYDDTFVGSWHGPLGALPPVQSLVLRLPDMATAFASPGDPENYWSVDSFQVDLLIPPSTLQHLTSLEFTCNWIGVHLLEILIDCKNLETLTVVHMMELLPDEDTEDTPIQLPHLRTLRLRKCGLFELLAWIVTPALTTLDISFDDYTEAVPRRAFTNLQAFVTASRLKDSVKTLRLANASFKAPESYLQLFSSPTKLVMDGIATDWDRLWSHRLQVPGGALECLSKLRKLKILRVRTFDPPTFLNGLGGLLWRVGPNQCVATVSFAWDMGLGKGRNGAQVWE